MNKYPLYDMDIGMVGYLYAFNMFVRGVEYTVEGWILNDSINKYVFVRLDTLEGARVKIDLTDSELADIERAFWDTLIPEYQIHTVTYAWRVGVML